MSGEYEVAVVGAGIGGLSVAALLAKRGMRVVVLEAMGIPGGCAQTFRRGAYRFDAGATTVVGLEPHLPLGRLSRALGVTFPLERVDPGMSVWLDGCRIDRHTNRERWISEAVVHFGAAQDRLWRDVFRASDLGWRVASNVTSFPPAGVADVVRAAGQALPDAARLVPLLLRSTASRVRAMLGRSPGARFQRFLDEQLLITAQASADRVPYAIGALALSYTNLGNYTAAGGIGTLAETLVSSIRASGGHVRYGQRVTRIERRSGSYALHTKRAVVEATRVVGNLTVWDMASVCDDNIGAHFRRLASRLTSPWGSVTLYLGVEDSFRDDSALHHQIVFGESIPLVGARSAFVSLSPCSDPTRAPSGRRAVTVSVHTPIELWWRYDRDEYEAARTRVADAILERIGRGWTHGDLVADAPLVGTPRTFVRYTHRERGRVGGVPSTFSTLLRPASPVTPLPGLFMIGDTVFPGQGIPAVVLGALNLAARM